ELLYIEVLYTIKHKIGTTSGTHTPYIQDLYQYAQYAFGVSPEDHARLLAKATEEKPPIVILNLTVVEARGLEAKDADGFSDPYCMMGIMPARNTEDPTAFFSSDDEFSKPKEKDRMGLKKFSSSLKKKKDKAQAVRDLVPAKLIRTTSVKPNTLNPLWNEKFRFDLDDVHTDRLHLDIWDHDDEFSVVDAAKRLNEVSGIKGLGRFFKQVAQSARTKDDTNVDDFLGCVNIQFDDIPSIGHDKWYKLEGRSARSNIQGEIHLKCNLATREDRGIPEDDNWTDILQHEDLMRIMIEHEIRNSKTASYLWNGELPQAAKTILHQHAIQGDITDVQRAMCRWMAYSRKHTEYSLDYELLLKLLFELDKIWKPGTLSREEEECLAESFNIFIEYSLNLLRRHREIFPPSNKAAFVRLEGMLRCLVKIYDMKVFKKCCPFIKDLHPEITHVIKKGTLEWYERQATTCRSQAKSLLDLTNTLNSDIHMALHYYNKVFQEHVSVDYFHIVYRHLDKLLGDELHQDLKTILKKSGCDKEILPNELDDANASGTSLFELYLAIQEFTKYSSHLPHKDRHGLNISQYFEWFRCAVSRWLCIARQKSFKRIRKAVELDKVTQMDMSVKYSTSAVDVCCCFVQITDFWKQLSWPDYVGAFPFVLKLTEDICEGAELYADLVHEKLIKAGYYDEEGQFDVTEQLCITINNIEQVRRALKPLPETLNFHEIKKAVEVSNGEHKTQGQTLNNLIKKADDMMVRKIKQVVERVADKMRPDIKKDVFHLNWAPESVPADDAIGDLLEYLDTNLLTLNNNLLKTNFDRILESIWVEVMEEFQEVMEKEERPPVFYQRMFDALGVLVDFFHANGKGLSMDDIITDQFQSLRERLSLHKMDTPTLIETFFNSKCQDQVRNYYLDNSEYGILNVRVCYRMDAHTLLVEVLSAKDVIPLDANGLSDPFVLVQLLPEHVFPNVSVQSTKVIKKTLNPLFEETFEFTINPIQCQRHGATLLFTVMDHDLVFQNDFAGEAYLSMAEIPGVDGVEVSGYEALSIVALPLMHPKHKDHAALEILGRRSWDKDAQDFVKKR
ncbi:hypothetical protein LOTGIDRAFT_91451, partial [Lottia gigantea]